MAYSGHPRNFDAGNKRKGPETGLDRLRPAVGEIRPEQPSHFRNTDSPGALWLPVCSVQCAVCRFCFISTPHVVVLPCFRLSICALAAQKAGNALLLAAARARTGVCLCGRWQRHAIAPLWRRQLSVTLTPFGCAQFTRCLLMMVWARARSLRRMCAVFGAIARLRAAQMAVCVLGYARQ